MKPDNLGWMRWISRLGVGMILCCVVLVPTVWALNKVTNYAFTGSSTGWTAVNTGAGIDGCTLTTSTARTASRTRTGSRMPARG